MSKLVDYIKKSRTGQTESSSAVFWMGIIETVMFFYGIPPGIVTGVSAIGLGAYGYLARRKEKKAKVDAVVRNAAEVQAELKKAFADKEAE